MKGMERITIIVLLLFLSLFFFQQHMVFAADTPPQITRVDLDRSSNAGAYLVVGDSILNNGDGVWINPGATSGNATTKPTGVAGGIPGNWNGVNAYPARLSEYAANSYGQSLLSITSSCLPTGCQFMHELFRDIYINMPANANATLHGATGPVNKTNVELSRAIPAGTKVTFTVNMNYKIPHIIYTTSGSFPVVTYDSTGSGTLSIQTTTFATTSNSNDHFSSNIAFGIVTDPQFGSTPLGIILQSNHWIGDHFPISPGDSGSGGTLGTQSAKFGVGIDTPPGALRDLRFFIPDDSIERVFGSGFTKNDLTVFINNQPWSTGPVFNYSAQYFGKNGTRVDGPMTFNGSLTEVTVGVQSQDGSDDDGDGYTVNDGDCNDNVASIHPGATEICGDGVDQDCNGSDMNCPDDTDDDEDGYTENQGDCNDSVASIYPGATEICGDGVDQDCNGSDMSCPDDIDDDGDGYTESEGDCDDESNTIHPNAVELCDDDLDNNCDGNTDCDDSACDNDPACEVCTDGDGDGYYLEVTCGTTPDCNDNNINTHPDAYEILGDGIDNNCDGTVDEGMKDAVILFDPEDSTFYVKNDLSGGAADNFLRFGPQNSGWLPIAGDWNGDGNRGIGLFDPISNTFFLKDFLSGSKADEKFRFGPKNAGWLPIAGDWDGDGQCGIGLFDPFTNTFFLKNSFSNGKADEKFRFGPKNAGWLPIAGDWNGDGIYGIGLFDPISNTFFLKNFFSNGKADEKFRFGPKNAGWLAISGDWNGDGTDGFGLFNPDHSRFYLKNSFANGKADITFDFGPAGAGWIPPCTGKMRNYNYFQDSDGDGYGDPDSSISATSPPSGYVSDNADCNDQDAGIYPGATEICGDGIDEDCNGRDLTCPNDIDNDSDGYTENQGDCDDSAASIHPGATEICGDGIDQDCDGKDKVCPPDDIDDDGDGYTENQGDCNDSVASIHPGAAEICEDGIDQDCNGSDQECPDDSCDLRCSSGSISSNCMTGSSTCRSSFTYDQIGRRTETKTCTYSNGYQVTVVFYPNGNTDATDNRGGSCSYP